MGQGTDRRVARRRGLMLGLLMATSAFPVALLPATASAAQAEADGAGVEELVVTAQRREERLQDVPVAVTAVSGETLERRNFTDTANIQLIAPSVIFNTFSNPGSSAFGIRGVATLSQSNQTEQAVALVIDGVVMSVPGQGLGELSDIARVEVLRGPQGMLFGKNASAGVIQVITENPDLGAWGGKARLSYASRNEARGSGSVNLPVGETAALRLSGFYRTRDGYIYNAVRREDQNDDESFGARVKFLWRPSDKLSLVAILDASQTDHLCCVPTVRSAAPGGALANLIAPYGVVANEENETSTLNFATRNYFTNHGASLEANYQLGDFTLTSITAWRDFKSKGTNDIDARPIDNLSTITNSVAKQTSQEFRLASPTSGRLDYVLGLYYYRKVAEGCCGFVFGDFGVPAIVRQNRLISTGTTSSRFVNTSYAAFGQATFAITDAFDLIAGARYTRDDYKLNSASVPVPGYIGFPPTFQQPNTTQRGESDNDNWSWRFGGAYKLTGDINAYATVARGYKGPVPLNDTPTSIRLSRAEIPTSYEVGLKSVLFERRLILNLAAWTAKYKDFQASVFDYSLLPPAARTTNAGSLKTEGVEVEFNARLTREFSLSGGVTLQKVRFQDFRGDACFIGQTAAEGCVAAAPGSTSTITDSSGNRLPNAPDLAWSLAVNYERPISAGLNAFANANYYWKDAVYFASNNSPFLRQDSYGVFGATAGVASSDGRWRLSVFARNLFDQFYVSRLIDVPNSARGDVMQYHDAEARRYVGVALNVNWGG